MVKTIDQLQVEIVKTQMSGATLIGILKSQ